MDERGLKRKLSLGENDADEGKLDVAAILIIRGDLNIEAPWARLGRFSSVSLDGSFIVVKSVKPFFKGSSCSIFV
jgi:hypothetical protein